MTNKLATIVLYVTSVPESVAFYRALGFEVEQARPDYAAVAIGDQLYLSLHEEGAETIPEFQEAAAVRPRGAGAYYYFEVSNVFTWSTEHASVCAYDSPIDRPWGKTEMLVKDPDGYLLMFYS